MNGVIYVSKSSNSKTSKNGAIDTIYVSTRSCPKTCTLKDKGCYALVGTVGIHTSRMNREAEGMDSRDIARAEAKAIDNSYKGGPVPPTNLRLHVVGDCKSATNVRIVDAAIKRWKARGGKKAFTYTHAWNKVLRSDWANTSVLASIDSIEQASKAKERGFACSLVVGEHASKKAYKIEGSDITWLPCPAQTSGKTCEECKICMDADKLFRNNQGVTFAAHGIYKNIIKRRLNVIK
jgi:hypothetical protein